MSDETNTDDAPRGFFERGLHFPLGIAIGLGIMVLWNVFFVYKAVSSAPEVDIGYTHAIER